MDDIRELERLTLATSPALNEEHYDGWVLRASGTDTRRANSVTQLEPGRFPLSEKIDYCEAWYAKAKQPSTFRLTTALSPETLDGELARRGYAVFTPSHIMTMALAEVKSEADDVALQVRSAAEGIADLHSLKGSDAALAERDTLRQAQWTLAEHYLALRDEGRIVACGMARADGKYVGIFNMRAAHDARGRGFATRLASALLTWGREQGAARAFLQVEQSNVPAVKLYRRAGFEVAYDYHYRVLP